MKKTVRVRTGVKISARALTVVVLFVATCILGTALPGAIEAALGGDFARGVVYGSFAKIYNNGQKTVIEAPRKTISYQAGYLLAAF